MRLLIGLGKRRRLRIDQPTTVDEVVRAKEKIGAEPKHKVSL
jgi:hypothetical protein